LQWNRLGTAPMLCSHSCKHCSLQCCVSTAASTAASNVVYPQLQALQPPMLFTKRGVTSHSRSTLPLQYWWIGRGGTISSVGQITGYHNQRFLPMRKSEWWCPPNPSGRHQRFEVHDINYWISWSWHAAKWTTGVGIGFGYSRFDRWCPRWLCVMLTWFLSWTILTHPVSWIGLVNEVNRKMCLDSMIPQYYIL
jgi:hypothetical protein